MVEAGLQVWPSVLEKIRLLPSPDWPEYAASNQVPLP